MAAKQAIKIRLRAGTHTQWLIDPKTGKPVLRTKTDSETGEVVMKPKVDRWTGKVIADPKTNASVLEEVVERVQIHCRPSDEFWAARDLVAEDPRKFEYASKYNPDSETMQRPGEPFEDFVERMVRLRDERKQAGEAPAPDEEEEQPAGSEPDGLENMTVPQLRELAKRNGVEVGPARTKDELVAAIRKAAQPA